MTRPRRLPTGLRARLVVALVLTSAATLVVVALGLLSPLASRLSADELRLLERDASAFVPHFAHKRVGDVEGIEQTAEALHRRAAARVVVFRGGRVIADTEAGRRVAAPPLPARSSNVLRLEMPLRFRGRHRTILRDVGSSPLARRVELRSQAVPGPPGTLVIAKQLSSVPRILAVVRRALLVAALAGLAVSAALGVLVARRLLRRLEELTRATHRLAEGETTALPRDRGQDEVGRLTRSFGLMQARLTRQEEARRQFVATASHELRTPLASLAVMLELAADDLRPGAEHPARALEQITRAQEQARRLSGLARDLLDLSRVDAGLEVRREPVDVSAVARAICSEFGLRAEGSDVRLQGDGDGAAWALADPGAVAQIARILVDNALRFAPPHSAVRLASGHEPDGAVTLTVADEGPGVARDDAARIFDRFARGDRVDPAPGFGLGLAIGRELAAKMGGTLTLAPSSVGARFVLALPPAQSRADDVATPAPEVVGQPTL